MLCKSTMADKCLPRDKDGREYQGDNSHVAYMSNIDGGDCPPTHPRHFVHLFYEMLFNVNSIDQSDGGQYIDRLRLSALGLIYLIVLSSKGL